MYDPEESWTAEQSLNELWERHSAVAERDGEDNWWTKVHKLSTDALAEVYRIEDDIRNTFDEDERKRLERKCDEFAVIAQKAVNLMGRYIDKCDGRTGRG